MGEDDCNYTYQTAASRKLCCGTWWNQVSTQQLVEAKEVRMNLPFLLTPAFLNGDLDVNSVVLWVTWLKGNGLIYRNLPSFEDPSYILPCFDNNATSDKFVSIDLELFAKFDPSTFIIHSSFIHHPFIIHHVTPGPKFDGFKFCSTKSTVERQSLGIAIYHQRFGELFLGGCHFSDSWPTLPVEEKMGPGFFQEKKTCGNNPSTFPHNETQLPEWSKTCLSLRHDRQHRCWPKPQWWRFGDSDQPVGYPNGKILRLFRRYPCRN